MSIEYIDKSCPICGYKPIRKYTFAPMEEPITHAWECPNCSWLVED